MLIARVERKAEEYVKKSGFKNAPIDPIQIAQFLGLIVVEAPSDTDDISGVLMKSEKKTIIGVNIAHSENRKRFTIAHELGHFLLHQKENTFFDRRQNMELVKFRDSSSPHTNEEVEANCFAAALLMPKCMLEVHFELLQDIAQDSFELIKLLARKYKVSKEAMKYRLINLGLIKGITFK